MHIFKKLNHIPKSKEARNLFGKPLANPFAIVKILLKRNEKNVTSELNVAGI